MKIFCFYDIVIQKNVVTECVELKGLSRGHQELTKVFLPQLIHLENDQGTQLAISASLCLVTSKFLEGEKT